MATKIPGMQVGSPLHEVAEAYLRAVADGEYRTARVCLIDLMRSTGDPRVLAYLIRLTHEMEPPV